LKYVGDENQSDPMAFVKWTSIEILGILNGMNTLLFLLAVTSTFSLAEMKYLGSGMHGEKMAVNYGVLNTGKHLLVVEENIGKENGKTKFKQLQAVEIVLKKGETLSPYDGFKCRNKKNDLLYAIISKNVAKENAVFPPVKAWLVDQKNMKLNSVDQKNEIINCKWEPDGDSDYPY